MKNIEEFLKDTLDGKFAHISSDGLKVCGNRDQKCKMEFDKYVAIRLSIKLEYNMYCFLNKTERFICNNREKWFLTYDKRDEILKDVMQLLNDSYVGIGFIYWHDIEDIKTTYDKGIAIHVNIKYKDGSTICIKNIGNEN